MGSCLLCPYHDTAKPYKVLATLNIKHLIPYQIFIINQQ